MDKKAFLEFLLISLFIIVAWQLVTVTLFGKPQRRAGQAPLAGPEQPRGEAAPQAVAGPERPGPAVEAPGAQIEEKHGLILENENLRASWTNRGAALESLTLKRYRAPYSAGGDGERPLLCLVRDFQRGVLSDVVERVTFLTPAGEGFPSREDVPTESVLYEVKEVTPDHIVFEGVLDRVRGLVLRKSVSVEPGTYDCAVTLEFFNEGERPLRFTYRLRGPAGIERESLHSRYLGTVVAVREGNRPHVTLVRAGSLRGGNRLNESAGIVWAGLVNQYFVAFVQPERSDWVATVESRLLTDTDIAEGRGRWSLERMGKRDYARRAALAQSNATTVIRSTEVELPPGGPPQRHAYRFVGAPILKQVLEPRYGVGITKALRASSLHWMTSLISLGTVGWISPLMVGILEAFHSVVRNYGVAIILLTVLVRLALHPLTRMSQVSMRKMQLLQPRLLEIQKKYKDDRQKQVQEQMALYRRYGVHPLSGCWPVFLQMPVFIALFVTLRTAVQLRQAPFIPGWINDLSQPDTVWRMPFSLPVLGNSLNVLPFLMVGMWMLNQHFMPKPADPRAEQQQKFMKWMPILFAVMLYNFASGLLLYWTTSSALGTLEQWFIRRQMAGLELRPVDEDRPAKRSERLAREGARPGFLARVLQRVEEQQRRSARPKKGSRRGKPR